MSQSYWKLDPHLQKVLKGIKINDEERKSSNEVCHVEVNNLIRKMRVDPVFDKVFTKLTFGGSTYENLKITAPNEFDLNMELNLPIKKARLTVKNSHVPGFVKLIVDDVDNALAIADEAVRRNVKSWLDDRGCVLRTKVYQWVQGVLDTALINYESAMKVSIHRRTSGPAFTLKLRHPEHGDLSIDLSPVFSFAADQWPSRPYRHHSDVRELNNLSEKNWYAVPKSTSSFQDNPELWRTSFYQCEKHMMNGREQLKPTVKLMKALRDKQDWKGLSSYYIKTIFMWKQFEENPAFWKKSLGELFIHMLEVIEKHLDRKAIPFFWNNQFNLIEKLNPDFKANTSQRIMRMRKRILANLDEHPETVLAYFTQEITPSIESKQNTALVQIAEEGIFSKGRCCIL